MRIILKKSSLVAGFFVLDQQAEKLPQPSISPNSVIFAAKESNMKLSHLSETLISSEIVDPGEEIRENPVTQAFL